MARCYLRDMPAWATQPCRHSFRIRRCTGRRSRDPHSHTRFETNPESPRKRECPNCRVAMQGIGRGVGPVLKCWWNSNSRGDRTLPSCQSTFSRSSPFHPEEGVANTVHHYDVGTSIVAVGLLVRACREAAAMDAHRVIGNLETGQLSTGTPIDVSVQPRSFGCWARSSLSIGSGSWFPDPKNSSLHLHSGQ